MTGFLSDSGGKLLTVGFLRLLHARNLKGSWILDRIYNTSWKAMKFLY